MNELDIKQLTDLCTEQQEQLNALIEYILETDGVEL